MHPDMSTGCQNARFNHRFNDRLDESEEELTGLSRKRRDHDL